MNEEKSSGWHFWDTLEQGVNEFYPALMTRKEVQIVMRISDRTLRSWIQRGLISEFREKNVSPLP